MENKGIRVLCLNEAGAAAGRELADHFGVPLEGREGRVDGADLRFPNALDHVRDLFLAGHAVVAVAAAGILVRAVAPVLSDKRGEPPLVAVSADGQAVPLLGGHRGANRLAREAAEVLGGAAAVTTGGDVALGLALDEPPAGWRLANPEAAKPVMAKLLSGGGATVEGEAPWLDGLPEGPDVRVVGSEAPVAPGPDTLVFHPTRHALGVGCARNCPPEELHALALSALDDANVAPEALAGVFSLDLKADEPAVRALADALGVPCRFFPAEALEAERARLANPSDVVFAEVGCHGVAEGAALAAVGPEGSLVLPKRKSEMATVALARAEDPITEPAGREPGRVTLVGIGPGKGTWRTPAASRAVAEADLLVGYSLYIDLLGPLAAGKPRADFPLGGEEARCRHALEAAAGGERVALICSGDAGIYAMAALVYELLDRGDLTGAASRVDVVTEPGISALQAAAARSGALLGHDFCAISLSDLLTPRDDILRRIDAAGLGDFVIAFYNPVSKTRRTLLAEARERLLAHRPAETPVILARSLGRPDESIRHRTLAALDVDEVDMMTVVLVGSSQSRRIDRGLGPVVYTPRGYAAKERT